jgi:threonine synthase
MTTGKFHKSPAMLPTLSEAINVQMPYNFERLLFFLTQRNHKLVKEWMTEVDETQKLDLDQQWVNKLAQDFQSARVTDEEMCETVRYCQSEFDYLADPHTAIALCAAEKLGYKLKQSEPTATALLATASPCKFQESMVVAIGQEEWDKYMKNDFPASARGILEQEEVPPTIYRATGGTLEETQAEWEKLARKIMTELGAGAGAS